MVAVKQLILIMLVYFTSFVPPLLIFNVPGTSVWISYLFYINNVANFFVYLAVNKEFRKKTKMTVIVALNKVRPAQMQNVFVLH